MCIWGYARASSFDQDTTLQVDRLTAAGCVHVFEEKASGTKREGRGQLEALLIAAQPGHTVMVTRIDRLARSMKDLQDIAAEWKKKGVTLRATDQAVDTSSAAGKAFFDMLGVFAEFETNLRKERQLEGIAAAKAKTGPHKVYKGRPRKLPGQRVAELTADGVGATDIAKRLGMSRASVYRLQREAKAAVTGAQA